MESLKLIKKLTPEIVEVVDKRYKILRYISYNEPIGRRSVSNKLDIQERTVRNEANILKEQGLLNIHVKGMNVTEEGKKLLDDLQDVYMNLMGIPELEIELKNKLNILDVTIIPGDTNNSDLTLKELGQTTSKLIKKLIEPKDIIGVTGGTTMATVAEECISDRKMRDITVIPARGGLGSNVYTQSNSIAAELAEKMGGDYHLLYVPDGLSQEALDLMMQNQEIKKAMDLIENMDVLIFGIGRSDVMAKRRDLSPKRIDYLKNKGAVAEAFGHYFDICGNEVWEYKTIGLSMNKFKQVENAIGVAGGKEKAEAIIAVSTLNNNMRLVTDELAAKEILRIKEELEFNKNKEES